jgi:hypothetical protein
MSQHKKSKEEKQWEMFVIGFVIFAIAAMLSPAFAYYFPPPVYILPIP